MLYGRQFKLINSDVRRQETSDIQTSNSDLFWTGLRMVTGKNFELEYYKIWLLGGATSIYKKLYSYYDHVKI